MAEFDPRNYRYGTPTQVDVSDPGYQRSLKSEKLLTGISIRGANFPVYRTGIDEHVNSALRKSGQLKDFSFPLVIDPGRVALDPGPVYFIPAQISNLKRRLAGKPTFEEYINPTEVIDLQLVKLQEYKDRLKEAEPYADEYKKPTEISTNRSLDKKIADTLGVEFLGQEESTTYINGDPVPMYIYRFTPWEVLQQIVRSYELELEESKSTLGSVKKKLSRFEGVVGKYNLLAHDEVSGFVDSPRFYFSDANSWRLEQDQNHEAGRLKLLNQEIAQTSDISLDFHADKVKIGYFEPENTYQFNNFSLKIFLDSARQDKYGDEAFQRRREVRDLVQNKFDQSDQIVISGVTVFRENGDFQADKSLPQWAINLLSVPIKVGGDVLKPEDWVSEEAALVESYRKLTPAEMLQVPHHPLITQLTELYPSLSADRKAITDLQVAKFVSYVMSTPPGITTFASPRMPKVII